MARRSVSTQEHLEQCLALVTVSGLLQFSRGSAYLPFWNSLLSSLATIPSHELAFSLFELSRREGLVPDGYAFISILKVPACLRKEEQIHSLSLKLELDSGTYVLNSLIHAYSDCGMVVASRRVFDSAPTSSRDIVSWNSMISGYLHCNLCREALQVFQRMVRGSAAMDPTTPVSALIACARTGALDVGQKIHALILINGFDMNCYLGSSLISMYAKCGAVRDARKLFDGMPDRNAVCWTSMISGYAHSGQLRESVQLFREMQIYRVSPNNATIASVLSSCAQLGALDQGRYIHAYCDMSGVGTNLTVRNALIDMYAKCGDIGRALQIFQGLVQRDVFSWTVIIAGLAMNGKSKEALDLFVQMEISGDAVPNEITFLGVLASCSHGGLVEEGYHHFNRMATVYKLTPRIEHYGCMVDLLGRAKLLVEAERFIKEMPIEPDTVIWRSLLFACLAYGNVKLAEDAAQQIIELEPDKCGGHVLLSNVYAVASRWSDVNRLRMGMNDSSIQKQPGCSFIEVDCVLYEFLATDTSHKQTEAIHRVLLGINRLLSSEHSSANTLGLSNEVNTLGLSNEAQEEDLIKLQ